MPYWTTTKLRWPKSRQFSLNIGMREHTYRYLMTSTPELYTDTSHKGKRRWACASGSVDPHSSCLILNLLYYSSTLGGALSLSPTKRRSRGNPRGGASPRVKKKRKETLRMRLSTLADHVSKPWFRETWNIFRCI